MTILEAKSSLEKRILFWDGIIGVGIVKEGNLDVIEVAVSNKNISAGDKVYGLCNNRTWNGFKVNIIFVDNYIKF